MFNDENQVNIPIDLLKENAKNKIRSIGVLLCDDDDDTDADTVDDDDNDNDKAVAHKISVNFWP